MPALAPKPEDTRLTEIEMLSLKMTSSEQQWNAALERIKAARGGKLPLDWENRVLASGLYNKLKEQWAAQ